MGKMKGFLFLPHTGDIKFRVFGKTKEKMFEQVIEALAFYISRGQKIRCKEKKRISIKGADNEQMLYRFIEEILYLLDAKGFVACKGRATIKKGILRAKLEGDKAENYDLDHIKAATYAEMYVKQKKDKGWEAQAVVDV